MDQAKIAIVGMSCRFAGAGNEKLERLSVGGARRQRRQERRTVRVDDVAAAKRSAHAHEVAEHLEPVKHLELLVVAVLVSPAPSRTASVVERKVQV